MKIRIAPISKVIGYLLLGIIVLFILTGCLLQSRKVQDFLLDKALQYVKQEYNAEIQIKRVRFAASQDLILEQVFIPDHQKDTLFFADYVSFHFSVFNLLMFQAPYLERMALDKFFLNLYQDKRRHWNYQFLLSSGSDAAEEPSLLLVSLRSIYLSRGRVHIQKKDTYAHLRLSSLNVRLNAYNEGHKFLDLADVALRKLEGQVQTVPDTLPALDRVAWVRRMQTVLREVFQWEWHMKCAQAVLDMPQILWRHGQETFFIGTTAILSEVHKYSNYSEQKITLKKGFINDWRWESLALDFLLDNTHLALREGVFNDGRNQISTQASVSYNHWEDSTYAAFLHSLEGYLQVQIPAFYLNTLHTYLDSSKQKYFPADAVLSVPAFRVHFKDTVLSIDSLAIKQKARTLWQAAALHLAVKENLKIAYYGMEQWHLRLLYEDFLDLAALIPPRYDSLVRSLGALQIQGHLNGDTVSAAGTAFWNSDVFQMRNDWQIKKTQIGYRLQSAQQVQGTDKAIGGFFFKQLRMECAADWEKGVWDNVSYRCDGRGIAWAQYRLDKLSLQGRLQHQLLEGRLGIEDDAVRLRMQYELDFSDKKDLYLFQTMHIEKLKMGLLQWREPELLMSGNWTAALHWYADSVSRRDIKGQLSGEDITFANERQRFFLNKIQITAQEQEGKKTIRGTVSDLGYFYVKGYRNIAELPRVFLKKYYDLFPYQNAVTDTVPSSLQQALTFALSLRHLTDFNPLLHERLARLDSVSLHLELHQNDSAFLAIATNGFNFHDLYVGAVRLRLANKRQQLWGQGNVDSLRMGHLLVFNQLTLRQSADTFWLRDGRQRLHIPFSAYLTDKKSELLFYPAFLYFYTEQWRHAKTTRVSFFKEDWVVDSLALYSGVQRLNLSTDVTPHSYNTLNLSLQNMDIEPLWRLLDSSQIKLEGVLNVHCSYSRNKNAGRLLTLNYQLQHFRMNEDSIGLLEGHLFYDEQGANFLFKSYTDNKDYNFTIETKNNLKAREDILYFHLNRVNLHLLSPYTQAVFEDLGGFAQGDLVLKKVNNKIWLEGALQLGPSFLKVDYTKCVYRLDPMTVLFQSGKVIFPKVAFRDIWENQGEVGGYLVAPLGDFPFYYDFKIRSDKILGMQTAAADNNIFWGQVLGKVSMETRGTGVVDSLWVRVNPVRMTKCYVNVANNVANEERQELKFVHRVRNVPGEKKAVMPKLKEPARFYVQKQPASSKFYAQLTINSLDEDIETALLFQKDADSKIDLWGKPHLKLVYRSDRGMSIDGKFQVSDGQFKLSFKNLVRKEFLIDRNHNNFISWTGDPEKPNVHLKMYYLVEKVPLNSLQSFNTLPEVSAASGSNSGVSSGIVSTALANINVYVILQGTPSRLNLDFDLSIVNTGALEGGLGLSALNNYIQALRYNSAMMRNQVSSLLFLNTFTTTVQDFSANTSQSSFVANYAGQILSTAFNTLLSQVVNSSLSTLISSKKVSLGLNYNAYNTYQVGDNASLSVRDIRSQIGFNMNIKQSDRITWTFSPSVDFNTATFGETNVAGQNSAANFFPNANFKYNITRDGLISFNVFNWGNYDNLTRSQRNQTGISFLVNKDFDIKRRSRPEKKINSGKIQK